MSSTKAIKRKAQAPGPYREALIALGFLHQRLEKLSLRPGDLVLFKLGNHSEVTTEMIRVFLDVASQRGFSDLNAFLMKPGDSVETLSAEAFDQLARSRGYYSNEDLQECCRVAVKEASHAVSEQ